MLTLDLVTQTRMNQIFELLSFFSKIKNKLYSLFSSLKIQSPSKESDSDEQSSADSVPKFDQVALRIGEKKFAAIKNSADFNEMIQDGEIDYYGFRSLP